MALRCGIVGLPNAGKSTLFNALTKSHSADAKNFPFCTIDPNVGMVEVPDERFKELAELIQPKSKVPAAIEFVDIAGLVRGASKGEGLGNTFLSHIRQVDSILHVVRCFEEENVIHVSGQIDPVSDVETIELELILSDLETIEKRINKLAKSVKARDKEAITETDILRKLTKHLKSQKMASELALNSDEESLISHLGLITKKPMILVGNVHEDELEKDGGKHYLALSEYARTKKLSILPVCAKVESELIDLSSEEEKELLKGFGIYESGLNAVIREAYKSLGYITFFTAGEQEVKAWTIVSGTKAAEAAGKIHTDIQRGFIRAEVTALKYVFAHSSMKKAQQEGHMRLEGKEYGVQDGDVIYFRFNV